MDPDGNTDPDGIESESELYDYAEDDNLDDLDRHLEDDIDEIENNIDYNDQFITQLQDELDNLYKGLTEDQLVFTEFQEEINIVQQKIAQARIDSIQQFLNAEQLTKLRAELMEVFNQAKNLKYPEHVLALSNFEEKKLRLSKYEEGLRSKAEGIIETYKILNFRMKKEEQKVVKDRKDRKDRKAIEVNTEDVKWFIQQLPETEEEEELVISYFYNNFSNLSRKQSTQIFGSYEESRNIYNSLESEPDFQKLQSYILELIALVESDHYKLMSKLKDLGDKEANILKNRVIKLGKFKKSDVLDDFEIINGNVSQSELDSFMEENDIDDPDKAALSYSQKIMSKYSKYLPGDDQGHKLNPRNFLKKSNPTIPIRNAPSIKNPKFVGQQEKDYSFDDYSIELEKKIFLQNQNKNQNKLDLRKLDIILSKFPKNTLLNCINQMGYKTPNSYMNSLFINKFKIKEQELANKITGELRKYETDFKPVEMFEYFTLSGKGLTQMIRLLDSNTDPRIKSELDSWRSEIRGGRSGPSFQRISLNSNTPKYSNYNIGGNEYKTNLSFKCNVGEKEYKIIAISPPNKNTFVWKINNEYILEFKEYLEKLRDQLRSNLKLVKTPISKTVIINKIKSINKYLGNKDQKSESVLPRIVNPKIKDTQIRIIEKQKLIGKILLLPVNIPQKIVVKQVSELERVAASCVSSVSRQTNLYQFKLEEIYYTVMLYPDIISLMVEGKILPTDVINIKSGFTGIKQTKTFEQLVNWRPSTQELNKQEILKSKVEIESAKDIPIETLIQYDDVKDLNIPIISKKAIVQESYEYIKWIVVLKRAKDSLDNGVEKERVTKFLNREYLKLPSNLSVKIPLSIRINTVKKFTKKVEYCKNVKDRKAIANIENNTLAVRIEMVVYQLSLNVQEYKKTVQSILTESINKKTFCDLLTPNNTALVNTIAQRYIIMPRIFKGNSDQEVLANASIPVLRAIGSLQNNMLDVIDTFGEVKSEIKQMGRQIALRNIVVKQMIRRKQERDAQEAFAVFNGKVNASDIEKINNQENNKLAKQSFKLLTHHNIVKWRNNIYVPPVLSNLIPRSSYSVIPLPNQMGFWIGGVFPDNVVPYRYVLNGDLRTHLEELSGNIGQPQVIEYSNNDPTQPPTPQELRILDNVQRRLNFRFEIRNKDYSINELETICQASGFGPNELSSFIVRDETLVPWNVLPNGDHMILNVSDYIIKLSVNGHVYRSTDSIGVDELRRVNQRYRLNLTKEETNGITDLEGIIKDYNRYLMLHDENLDPSLMYKRCIKDKLEPIPILQVAKVYKGKRELMLLNLKEFKKYKLKDAFKKGYRKPSDQEITKEYFEMKKSSLIIKGPNSPYFILDNKAYKVKKDNSNLFPVPVEYSGHYPVYSNNQLNDLGNLLLSGTLSPWLMDNIKPVYGNTPTIIKEGSYVNINGASIRGISFKNQLGFVRKIEIDEDNDAIYSVEYTDSNEKSKKIDEFVVQKLTPVIVNDITGFTGNPPWFTKNLNIKLAMDYLKSKEFTSLGDSDKKSQLTLIIKEFGIFGEDLSSNSIVKELEKQRLFLIKVMKAQSSFNKQRIIKMYDHLGFINPLTLKQKILERHKLLLNSWDYLNSNNYRILKNKQRLDKLNEVIMNVGIKLKNGTEKEVVALLSNSKKSIEETLVFLDTKYWVDTPFSEKVVMYNNIAKKMDILSEVINPQAFNNKIKIRLNDVQNAIKYLKSDLFNRTGKDQNEIMISIVNDFNIIVSVPKSEVVYKRLDSLDSNIGLISSFYIEQEFVNKMGKTIIVKNGVSKDKIIWRKEDWDPCNYLTNPEINKRIVETINYLRSEKFINFTDKEAVYKEIKKEWGIKGKGKKSIIKELESRISGGIKGSCSNNGFDCIWDTRSNICSSRIQTVNPIETPEQRVMRLLKDRNIEQLPKLRNVKKEFKVYKKDDIDVWSWQPYPKPRNGSKEYTKWLADPEVRLWNAKIKSALRELESILFQRLRVNSKSFGKRKQEITIELEEFRKRMKSQKVTRPEIGGQGSGIKKVKKSKHVFVPDHFLIMKNMVEDYLQTFLNNGIVRLTNDAKKMLSDIKNDRSLVGRIYLRFDIVKRDYGQKVIKSGNKEEKYNDIVYTQVQTQEVELLDILKNMSYTRLLELDGISGDLKTHGYGILMDYLIGESGVGNNNLRKPNKPVIIDTRDILDYMGDSYMQFGTYIHGVGYEEKDDNIEYSFIKPPCGYTTTLDKQNSYLTFNESEFQGVYIIGSDIHKKHAITSDVARRFALILGLDIRYIPPCFSSKPSEKEGRNKLNAITGEDIRSYFVRSGKGFYLEEMSPEDLKSSGSENLLYKQQKQQEESKKLYTKALAAIFKNKIEGKDLMAKTKTASRIFKIDYVILSEIVDIMEDENNMGKKAILESLRIPARRSESKARIKDKISDLAKQFKKDYSFDLSDYLKDPRLTKVDRVIKLKFQ